MTPAFDQREIYRKIRRTQALDPKTFRVVFRKPYALWRDLFPIVLPRHVLAAHDLTKVWLDRVDDPATGAAIGSGPFLIGRFERGKQITLVRNARYWGPHTAYLDRIVYRFSGRRTIQSGRSAGTRSTCPSSPGSRSCRVDTAA